MSKRKRKAQRGEPIQKALRVPVRNWTSAIELADDYEKRCTQAIALANLLMETDADAAVVDTAWVLRDLVENIRVIGRALHKRVADDSERTSGII